MKFLFPSLLLVLSCTLIVLAGFSMAAPEANLPWNPSNTRTYFTALLLLVGVALGMLGLGVLSSRHRFLWE